MAAIASIAVVEPQMHNLFHSPFNAALLHAIVLAFPDAKVSFSALAGHSSAVRAVLEEHAPEIVGRLEWRELKPVRSESLPYRWWSNRRTFSRVLGAGGRVVFCSISRLQLLQLKRMMAPRDEVLAVVHGDLERIAEPATERFPASLFALQRVLLTKQPRGLRFVVAGESIRRNIPLAFEAAFRDSVVIDHPYHFPDPNARASTGKRPVVFGVFGNSGDGRLLEQIARSVKAVNPEIRFRLVGFVADGEAVTRLAPLVECVGSEPISRDKFVQRAESITYALWLAPAGSFRLRASGTFFDALAWEKPLVYVANPFLDAYLSLPSAFAFRCAGLEDVSPAIVRMAERHDPVEYTAAQAGMREFRKRFTPEALAEKLPSKFGW